MNYFIVLKETITFFWTCMLFIQKAHKYHMQQIKLHVMLSDQQQKYTFDKRCKYMPICFIVSHSEETGIIAKIGDSALIFFSNIN